MKEVEIKLSSKKTIDKLFRDSKYVEQYVSVCIFYSKTSINMFNACILDNKIVKPSDWIVLWKKYNLYSILGNVPNTHETF